MRKPGLRSILGGLDAAFGPLVLANQRRREAGVLFLYHRIAPGEDMAYPPLAPDMFEQHCDFIQDHYDVLSLAEMVQRWSNNQSLKRCCAITFDDGYRDFLDYAYPILERYGFPATQYLIAECLTSGYPDWTYRHSRLAQHLVSLGETEQVHLVLDMRTELGAMTAATRQSWLDEQEAELQIPLTENLMLQSQDLDAFDPQLVQWGSHSLSHAMLGECDTEQVETELRESRRQLEDVVGAPIRYFAYPSNSYSPVAMRLAQDSGYQAAFAVDQRELHPHAHRYALPRFDVGAMPRTMLRLEVGGVTPYLRELRARIR